jgi:LysM repeat protein
MRKTSGTLVFVMLLCLLAVQARSANAQTPSQQTQTETASTATRTPGPTPDATTVVQLATPGEDGMITHIVVAGETLISIAEAYGVPVNNLLELNGFTADAVIFPGDELIIQAGFTPTATSPPTTTATETKVPTSTRRPTRTPAPQPQAGFAEAQVTLTPAIETEQPRQDSFGTVLLVAIAVLGGGGILMIIVGGFLRRNA